MRRSRSRADRLRWRFNHSFRKVGRRFINWTILLTLLGFLWLTFGWAWALLLGVLGSMRLSWLLYRAGASFFHAVDYGIGLGAPRR